MPTHHDYMTTAEVAELRRMTTAALTVERHEAATGHRETPPYLKIGTRVLYRRVDVERWLAAHLVEPQGAT